MTAFEQLGLSAPLLQSVAALGFEEPSEIQKLAIPQLLTEETDFIGLAQTGTGKTAAFGLPLLERIDPMLPHTQALILAPTRELGQQIAGQLEKFSAYQDKVNLLAVYGGANISGQIRALRQAPQHVIIATPGRLIDLINRKAVKLDYLQILVLDEADEMLNMGFKEEIDEILKSIPKDKQTWLFSATMSKDIQRIVRSYMHEPLEITVNSGEKVNANIEHKYAILKVSEKGEALTRFLDLYGEMRGVVFCRTKRDTQNLAEFLLKKNYKADALHGDLSQPQRDRVMKRFKTHELQVLVATDVAARGIDVNDLTHVFHFALPDDFAYYTHRSGRTARAGKEGISIAFITSREMNKLKMISSRLGIDFEKAEIPTTNQIQEVRAEKFCHDILDTRIRETNNEAILAQAEILFGNLSKEELIGKLLTHEMNKIRLGKDFNKAPQDAYNGSSDNHNGGGKRGGYGGGGRGKRKYGKKPYGSKFGGNKKGGKKKFKKKY